LDDLLVLDDDKLGALLVVSTGPESGDIQYLFDHLSFDRLVSERTLRPTAANELLYLIVRGNEFSSDGVYRALWEMTV
jgi:hypothetical protein